MSIRLSSQERRAVILNTAIRLFSERGFRGVTTRELSSALGVSEPVLYQHFPSKKDLYDAIIESSMDAGYYEALEGLKRVASTQNDEEFFRHVAQSMIRWFETRPDLLRLKMFSALEGHEMVSEFNERTSRPFVDIIVGYIQRRVEEGAFVAMNPAAIALSFCGMIAHHCMVTILFKSPMIPIHTDMMVDHAVKILLHGIKS